ncbi:hypothetical protein [Streptomyces sp. NBC_01465]|uniref:hypothetical protein n=1 Tax=Streptomyces sp. NBC_01465 TaxID=2903878 RepID=UPI002E37A516|nr:hypothetical protein [Streptomyces sp. NBC_01465]
MEVDKQRTVVADSFALYQISTGHTRRGTAMRRAAVEGRLEILVSTLAFTVACAMRSCWDEDCDRGHPDVAGRRIHEFYEQHGFGVIQPTVAESVAAARLYSALTDHRVVGPEVLAACSARLLARTNELPMLSTRRASYCYTRMHPVDEAVSMELI